MDKAVFRESDHTYWLGDKQLISVTQLMRKHYLATDLSFIDAEVLNKKAERGTLIHKEIEDYINTGAVGFTTELEDYISLMEEYELTPIKCEYIVNTDIVAGTIDLKAKDKQGNIVYVDFKTGTAINKLQCSWQLSLYEALDEKATELLVFHLGEKSKVIEIDRVPIEEIVRLLECERYQAIYEQKKLIVAEDLMVTAQVVERQLKELDAHKKELQAVADSFREAILNEMESQSVKSWESIDGSLKMTYIAPTTRESVDSVKLKKELPEVAKRYVKTSNVKASLRITIRD